MKNNTHTPGPWKIEKAGVKYPSYQITEDREPNENSEICIIHTAMSSVKEQAEANAKLIASAPELLEALQEAKDLLSNTYDIPDYESPGFMAQDKQSEQVIGMIKRLTEVINKATGN